MSSTIGKDQAPGLNPNVASRQQAEQQANAVERDQRAQRFRSSLTKPDTKAPHLDAGPRQSGSSKAGGKPEGGPEGPGRERERERADSGTLGLTGEQALVLEAALGGAGVGAAGGTGDKKRGGQAGEVLLDDTAVGGAGGLDRTSGKAGKTAGEDALAEVAAAVSAAAAPAHGQSWLRPEGPQRAESRARELPQPLPGVDPIHQLYIGRGPGGAEARMMITVGPLAGTEIQLREGPGGVQAAIITQNASSRETLTTAMAAVAERLKAKGQKLDVKFEGRPHEQGSFGRFAEQRPGK